MLKKSSCLLLHVSDKFITAQLKYVIPVKGTPLNRVEPKSFHRPLLQTNTLINFAMFDELLIN